MLYFQEEWALGNFDSEIRFHRLVEANWDVIKWEVPLGSVGGI
jgi:hypothetical protein